MPAKQKFGGKWTEQKLDTVEKYLSFYTTALKNQHFKLCYIDAFSGSGSAVLRDGLVTDGSAIRALQYPFDQYFFIEKNDAYLDALASKIENNHSDLLDKVVLRNGDCNELLQSIDSRQWKEEGWRGVIFLDPYAMDLDWNSLEQISQTEAFDVWYLFPLSAVSRNLYNDGNIPLANQHKLDRVFGAESWRDEIYIESSQQPLFGDAELEKIPNGLKDFIVKRLSETFPVTAKNPIVLTNSNNSPMFLLCFAASNRSGVAQGLALKGASFILNQAKD